MARRSDLIVRAPGQARSAADVDTGHVVTFIIGNDGDFDPLFPQCPNFLQDTDRLLFMRIVVVLVLVLLVYRIYWVQQNLGADLGERASANQFAILTTDPPRGVIFDRKGEPLAINQPSFNVTITPAFLPTDADERLAVFERLELLTGVPLTNTVEQEALIASANPELAAATGTRKSFRRRRPS